MEEIKPQSGFDRQDRDLLVRLNTRVEDLIVTIQKMDSNIAKDVGGLRDGKADKAELATHIANDEKDWIRVDKKIGDQEQDIKTLNKYLWIGMGIMIAVQFAVPLIFKYIK